MKRILTGLTIIGALLLVAPIGHSAEEKEKKPDDTVKMTGKSLRKSELQNPPLELYVCDLIRRLKSATD